MLAFVVCACSDAKQSSNGGGLLFGDTIGGDLNAGKTDGVLTDGAGSDVASSVDDSGVMDATLADLDEADWSGLLDDPDAQAQTDTSAFNPDAACNAIAAQGTPARASILFLLDYSWSMCWKPGGSKLDCATTDAEAKWSILVEALKPAVDALPANSVSALAWYPAIGGTNDSVCQVAGNPQVALAETGPAGSAQRAALINTLPPLLTDDGPIAQTPTGDALVAMYGHYAGQTDADLQGASRYLVLITDGNPSCSATTNNQTSILKAIGNATKGALPVKTFVVGVPGSEGFKGGLSQSAKAGGTAPANCSDNGPNYCHFDMTQYTTPEGLAKALGTALAAIQGQALACEYDIPPNPQGSNVDYTFVNVRYTLPGAAPVDMLYDPACTGEGWRYDDAVNPKKILMCPASCSLLTAEPGAKLDVLFGCPREEKDKK
jgi:hypothetical protein